jgi:hypothetical protein
MLKDREELLLKQIEKINDVIKVFNENFSDEVDDEINFLSVVRENLIALNKINRG